MAFKAFLSRFISSGQGQEIDSYQKLRQLGAKLVSADGDAEVLPEDIHLFWDRLLADLKAGNSVTILQTKTNLTTVEAGKLLGMSRQFLIRLLEKGEIPFHKVGTHRRMYVTDVLAYKAKRDTQKSE